LAASPAQRKCDLILGAACHLSGFDVAGCKQQARPERDQGGNSPTLNFDRESSCSAIDIAMPFGETVAAQSIVRSIGRGCHLK